MSWMEWVVGSWLAGFCKLYMFIIARGLVGENWLDLKKAGAEAFNNQLPVAFLAVRYFLCQQILK